jgi:hypothetical protein
VNQPSAISVQYDLSLADFRAMTLYLCSPQRLKSGSDRWIFLAAVGTIAVIANVYRRDGLIFLSGMFVACIVLFAYFRTVQSRSQTLYAPRQNGYVLCHYSLTLSETGIAVVTPQWNGETRWSGLVAAGETAQHVFLQYDTTAAHAIPKSAFAASADAARFLAYARDRMNRAVSPTPAA